jgi:N-acetylglucosaminyldiphosphoundecaprenol N-acetyl-beta-D-mannosaminyltransferase
VRKINDAKPDLLLVGMGHPIQEQWIDAHAAALDVPLIIAVGGLFGYWGNGLRRASPLFRRLGLEWLAIMLQQPRKIRRYLVRMPTFLVAAMIGRARDRRAMHGSMARSRVIT